ncbi:MAG: hypothetical protein IBX72_06965 [Nitrospirae bacterium]|jgi:hypothetical protein|nr:hypothetical protein [Nitrospirota bacterium]
MAKGYATNAIDASLRGLLAQGEVSNDLFINPKAIRPCIATMIKTGFEEGGIPDRSSISAILASEFVKLGFERNRIEHELLEWNRLNNPPLRQSAIFSTINTAIRRKYNYSCRYAFLKEFCIGQDLCIFSKGLSRVYKINFRLFFTYHWQLILSNKSKLVYWVALPELEKRKGLKPGSVIYENHVEIARFAGISKKYVRPALEELSAYGLIEYRPGTPRRWEGKATEVRRIFPIPKPPREAVLKVTNDP